MKVPVLSGDGGSNAAQAGVTADIPVSTTPDLIAFVTANQFYALGKLTTANDTATAALAIDTLTAYPFRMGSVDLTFGKISGSVATLEAACSFRVGIYGATPTTFYPSSLVVDSGNLDASAAGNKEAAVSFTLQSGLWYWAACITNTPGGVVRWRGNANGNILSSFFGRGAFNSADALSLTVARAFGALPTVFPAGAALTTAESPQVLVRR